MPILDASGTQWMSLGKDGKPVMQEIATIERDINRVFYGKALRNEDETLISRGGTKGLKIYDELKRDAHAGAVLAKRKLAVTSRPWVVDPASEKPADKAAAELVLQALQSLKFNHIRKRLLEATLKGYAVSEILWGLVDGRVMPVNVKARDPRRFVFGLDDTLRLRTATNMVEGEPMPDRKFIVHRRGADDDSPYGTGVGGMLFWPVFFKRNTITFWLTFADKFGSPTAIGKYPNGAGKPEQNKLLAALRAISQDAGVIVPDGMLIELLEAERAGSVDTYEKLVRYMDEQMSKAVLGETMSTTASSAGMGSNQATVQNDVRIEVAKDDADELDETLNATLVKWIVEFNIPGAACPKLRSVFDEPEDQTAAATRDKTLHEMGWELTEEAVAEKYGEGYVKRAPAPPPDPMGGFGGFGGFGGRAASPSPAPGADEDEDPAQFEEGKPLQKARGFNANRQQALADGAEALAANWRDVLGKRVEDLMSMLDETGDLVQFRERMDRLLDAPPDPKAVDAIARATFAANQMGRGRTPPKDKPPTMLQRALKGVLGGR